jgi:hypothetical protein
MMVINWEETHIQLKKGKALVVAGKETGIEVNTDKTRYSKYRLMSRDQNAGRSKKYKD